MTELYTPKTIKPYAEEDLPSQDYESALRDYEEEPTAKGSFPPEQQEKLLEIEEGFVGQTEWRSMYVRGRQRGLDENDEVNLAIYMSENPERNVTSEGWQVRMWDDAKNDWCWQGVNYAVRDEPSLSSNSGEFPITTQLILENGKTLGVCLVNKFADQGEITQELRSVQFTSIPETKFESVSVPTSGSHEDSRGAISSKIKHIPDELSDREAKELEYKRLANQERYRQIRSKHGLGATAVGDRACM